MTIVYLCPVAFAATGLFHSGTVSEFGTVIDSDRSKDFAEICAVFTFKAIQDADHASGGLVAHRTNDFPSGLSFGQNQKGFLCFLLAFDTVHFPVTNDRAIVDFFRAVFDTGPSRWPLRSLDFVIRAFLLAFDRKVLVRDSQKDALVDIRIQGRFTDRRQVRTFCGQVFAVSRFGHFRTVSFFFGQVGIRMNITAALDFVVDRFQMNADFVSDFLFVTLVL